MKKIFTLLLAFLMVFAMTGCFKKAPVNLASQEENTTMQQEDTEDTQEYSDETGTFNYSDDGLEYTDEEGNITSFTTTWPDNEYTKLIPKPNFGTISFTNVSKEDGFIVQIGGGTIEDTKKYVEELKQAGFTKNDELFDGTGMGDLETFSYSAQNGAGVIVAVDYALEIFMVQVTK